LYEDDQRVSLRPILKKKYKGDIEGSSKDDLSKKISPLQATKIALLLIESELVLRRSSSISMAELP